MVPLAGRALALPSAARAGSCEDSVAQKGNSLSGIRFHAEVTVAELSPPVAIRQLRGIAATRGYDIPSEEADHGSMLLDQPRSGAARVKLAAKLPAGMLAGAGGDRTELCAMQNAAERNQGAVSSAGPVVIDALVLSQQISQEADTNAATIPSRYQGKTFTINGRVAPVTKDGGADRIDDDLARHVL